MKKIVIITTCLCIVLLGFFVGVLPYKKIIAMTSSEAIINSDQLVNLGSITLQPHEMPASQIKEVLLVDLRAESICTSKEAFYVEHHPLSSKLLACLFMAIKDHVTARQLLKNNGRLTPQQLQVLRDHEATREAMRELEILEGQKIRTMAHKLETIVISLDV